MPTIDLRETGPIGSNTSAVNLGSILAAASAKDRDRRWIAFNWWAVGVNEDLDVGELEAKTKTGLLLSTAELQAIDKQLLQLIDGVIASYEDVPPAADESDLRATCGLVIRVVDSAYWRIYSRDASTLNAFRALGASVANVDDGPLPAAD